MKFNRFLSDQNAERSKPQYKGSIVVHHSVKKAATHIVTSHTYATGPPEVRRTYAAGARYVDPWSQRIKSIQNLSYSLMQGKTRKKQYYTQVARQ